MSLPSSESSWPKEAARHDRVLVVLATPVSGCFDYLVPPHLSVVIGSVVVAPFGNRRLPGIVLGPGNGDVALEKLRYLEEVAAVARTTKTRSCHAASLGHDDSDEGRDMYNYALSCLLWLSRPFGTARFCHQTSSTNLVPRLVKSRAINWLDPSTGIKVIDLHEWLR